MSKGLLTKIEQLENGTPADRIIKLKSVYKTGKTTVQPVQDRITGWYKGVPRLSDDEKKKLVYWAEPTSKFTIKDGTTFDLNDEAQRVTWEWVKHCPCIAASEEECQFTPGAEYYIHMENKQAEINVSRKEKKYKAVSYILQDNSAYYPIRAELLGVNMDGESPIVIKEFLIEQAELYPEKVLAIYESNDVSLRLLLLKAKKMNVVTIDGSGMHRYGNTVMGMAETTCIAWLQDPSNKHLVEQLEKEVSPEYFVTEDKQTEAAPTTNTVKKGTAK